MKIKVYALLALVPFFVTACGDIEDKQLWVTGTGFESLDETRDIPKFPSPADQVVAAKVDKVDQERIFQLRHFAVYQAEPKKGAKVSVDRTLKELGTLKADDTVVLRALFNGPADKVVDVDIQLNVPLKAMIDTNGAATFHTRYYNWTRFSSDENWQWRAFGESGAGLLLHDVFDVKNNKEDKAKATALPPNAPKTDAFTPIYVKNNLKTNALSEKDSGIEATGTTTFHGDELSFHYDMKLPDGGTLSVRLDYKLTETKPKPEKK